MHVGRFIKGTWLDLKHARSVTLHTFRSGHSYTAGGSETALLRRLFSLVFLFALCWNFQINFNFSWQPLTAKTKDFFPFIETDWPRVLLPSTDSRLHLLPPSPTPGVHHPPTSPPHPHSHSFIRTQSKQLKP